MTSSTTSRTPNTYKLVSFDAYGQTTSYALFLYGCRPILTPPSQFQFWSGAISVSFLFYTNRRQVTLGEVQTAVQTELQVLFNLNPATIVRPPKQRGRNDLKRYGVKIKYDCAHCIQKNVNIADLYLRKKA